MVSNHGSRNTDNPEGNYRGHPSPNPILEGGEKEAL